METNASRIDPIAYISLLRLLILSCGHTQVAEVPTPAQGDTVERACWGDGKELYDRVPVS